MKPYLTCTHFTKSSLPEYPIHSKSLIGNRLRLQPLPLQIPMEVHGARKVSKRLSSQTSPNRLYTRREQVLMTISQLITSRDDHRHLRQGDALVAVRTLHEFLLDGGGELVTLLVRLHFVSFRHLEEFQAAEVFLALVFHPLLEEELAYWLLVYHVFVPDICESIQPRSLGC